MNNCARYAKSSVTVSLKREGEWAVVCVKDDGPGLDEKEIPHLFERFYRADASRGEKSGFGLGLAIADTIAREHKGALKAESDTASTRFTFTMPLRKQA